MFRLLAFFIVAFIAISDCALIEDIQPEEVITEDFTDSGVGCVDDCLDPATVEAEEV